MYEAKERFLFIDEIHHRFNKDMRLSFCLCGDGTHHAIGATQRILFEVWCSLLSRSIVFELQALEIPEEIKELLLLELTVNDKEKGMGAIMGSELKMPGVSGKYGGRRYQKRSECRAWHSYYARASRRQDPYYSGCGF